MRVTLIASTSMDLETAIEEARDETGKEWTPENMGGSIGVAAGGESSSLLTEFAGRACYQSFDRPNAGTRSNAGYLKHIIDVNHGSVMEHGSATFYVTGVSRSLTHELVRHRHLSFSQVSQRFVNVRDGEFICPPLFEDDAEAHDILVAAWDAAQHAYEALVALGERRASGDGTAKRKRAREAARAVLPNMTPTSIVVTGNHRAWREFLAKRATLAADAEIREMAIRVWDVLRMIEPGLYQDFSMVTDGGTVILKQ